MSDEAPATAGAGERSTRGDAGRLLDAARTRLDAALHRLEQAAVGAVARKSAVETDRRHLGEAVKQLQGERDALKGFLEHANATLDAAIAQARAALVEDDDDPDSEPAGSGRDGGRDGGRTGEGPWRR